MKRSALIVALLALSLTACGEKPDEASPAVAPAAEPAPVVAPASEVAPASAVEPASAPEAMDSMQK